jgi:hypothetical protein
MTSDHSPPDSTASLDALWESLDDDDIPPALDPRSSHQAQRALPAELRDTVLPPSSAREYPQTMVELGNLGDLDDLGFAAPAPHVPLPSDGMPTPVPTGGPTPPAPSPEPSTAVDPVRVAMDPPPRFSPAAYLDPTAPAPVYPDPEPPPVGLVLASEEELFLGEASPNDAPISLDPSIQLRSTLANPALPRRAPFSGPSNPRASVATAAAGGRAGAATRPQAPRPAGRPPPAGIPIPRAPSIPPAAGAWENTPGELEVLPFDGAVTSPATPPSSSSPASSGKAPNSAGLRLGRSTPPMDEGDRVTPLAAEPALDAIGDRLREMVLRFDAHNFSGALGLAESVLASEPGNAEARRCAESCRDAMAQKYLSRLGGRRSVLRIRMSPEEIRSLSLDHRAGFLLSFIDGSMSIEEVLDVSSMPELDALRMMFELLEQGVIEIEPPRGPAARR